MFFKILHCINFRLINTALHKLLNHCALYKTVACSTDIDLMIRLAISQFTLACNAPCITSNGVMYSAD